MYLKFKCSILITSNIFYKLFFVDFNGLMTNDLDTGGFFEIPFHEKKFESEIQAKKTVLNSTNFRQNLGFKNLRPETDFFSKKQSYFWHFQTLTCLLRAEFRTKTMAQFGPEQISKYLGSKNKCSQSIKNRYVNELRIFIQLGL